MTNKAIRIDGKGIDQNIPFVSYVTVERYQTIHHNDISKYTFITENKEGSVRSSRVSPIQGQIFKRAFLNKIVKDVIK